MKTNRRNFIKTLTGLFALPISLSFAKNKKQKPIQQYEKFNYDNINYTGTFEQWIASIKKELERVLSIKSNESDSCRWPQEHKIIVTPNYWINEFTNEKIPAVYISVHSAAQGLHSYFGFSKQEFDKNNPEMRKKILQCRFIDFIWGLNDRIREDLIFVKKLGIDPSVPIKC